jgi:acyl carrier protein
MAGCPKSRIGLNSRLQKTKHMLNQRLAETIGSVLKVNVESITPDTSQQNTPAWDSMAHLQLVLRAEDAFGVRFRSDEIPALTSVRLIWDALERQGVSAK